MRSSLILAVLVVTAATFVPVAQSVAATALSCASTPPCGPIPVIITILVEKSRGLTFDANNKFETKGTVQYYFDIDQNGYAYDPMKEMWVTMKVNKQPPWTKLTLVPEKFQVPLRPQDACPSCVVTDDGTDPSQSSAFLYEHDFTVTVDKLRDPTPAELKKFTKSDGTYRASFSAVSNDSMAGTDPTGRPAGVMEGYGVKELRFLSSAEKPVAGASQGAQGEAPGAGILGFVGALGLAVLVVGLRTRREE